MYSFESTGKFIIQSRGVVYTAKNPVAFENGKCPFLNSDVLIDGKIFHVIGVETFALMNIRKGSDIGLLVKGE